MPKGHEGSCDIWGCRAPKTITVHFQATMHSGLTTTGFAYTCPGHALPANFSWGTVLRTEPLPRDRKIG